MNISINRREVLDGLAAMSNRYGGDPRFVLAGGGNSSWKDDNEMYIKASGSSLATISAEGFAGMDRRRLRALMDKQYDRSDDVKREAAVLSDMMASRLPGYDALRPSVETLLHNLFPYTYVLHLHPALVNGMTCGARGEAAARELFGDSVVWIPEYKPGYELSKLCERMIADYEKSCGSPPKLIFIQNHGVFVAADSVDEIDTIYADIMYKLANRAAILPAGETAADHTAPAGVTATDHAAPTGESAADHASSAGVTATDHAAPAGGGAKRAGSASQAGGGLSGGNGLPGGDGLPGGAAQSNIDYHSDAPCAGGGLPGGAALIKDCLAALPSPPAFTHFYSSPDLLRLLESRENFYPLSGAFTPDHIVYCKAYFLYLDGSDAKACSQMLPGRYADFTSQHGYEPRVICVRGIGAFICANTAVEADNAFALFKDALKVAVYSRNFGGPRHMSAELTDFIANWEIEQYRQKVARGQ